MARTAAMAVSGKRKLAADASPCTRASTRRRLQTRNIVEDSEDDELLNDENRDPCATTRAEKAKPRLQRVTKSLNATPRKTRLIPVVRVPLATPASIGRKLKNVNVTPSKTQLLTPPSERRVDKLAKPCTPTSRVTAKAKAPLTPSTPASPSANLSIYNRARQLFVRSANAGPLIGRETERHVLETTVQGALADRQGRCIYISGAPGTGKSAVVSQVCQTLNQHKNTRLSTINCVSVKSGRDLCSRLVSDFKLPSPSEGEDDISVLQNAVLEKKAAPQALFVAVLDEIDHLSALDSRLLLNLFEWALDPCSRLVLIGIANALDLTGRSLPQLKQRGLQPQLLPFAPYTALQIADIISSRLRNLTDQKDEDAFVPFVHPSAIQFTAKKIAAQTGDLRKAFDIIRRALEVIEAETRAAAASDFSTTTVSPTPSKTPPRSRMVQPLGENPNLCSPGRKHRSKATVVSTPSPPVDVLASFTPLTAPRATIAHVARIAAAALNHGTHARLSGLTLQQKAALCAVISLERRTAQRLRALARGTPSKSTLRKGACGTSVREAWEAYRAWCTHGGRSGAQVLAPLSRIEFGEVISGLEGVGLVEEVSSSLRGGRKTVGAVRSGASTAPAMMMGGLVEERHVETRVTESEVRKSLEGVGGEVLRSCLGSESPSW